MDDVVPQSARFCRMLARIALMGLSLLTARLSAQEDNRLDPLVTPVFQAIHLDIDPDSTHYSGSVRIELQVHEPTRTFRFHSEVAHLQQVALTCGEQVIPIVWEDAGELGLLEATAEGELEPGRCVLEIDFRQAFNTRAVGLYRVVYDDQGYLFTQFEAADARKAFPCWDEPGIKIPFQMSLRVPSQYEAVSNTPVESQLTEDGSTTHRFRRTPPLPTYLLALAAGPLEAVPIPGLGVPDRILTVRGQSHLTGVAVDYTGPILKALEAYFDQPYPFAKLDFLAVPEFAFGAMENPGAVTFRDDLLLLDPETTSPQQRRILTRVISHELAHMWYGDLVTMSWWDDLWLNETFADWMADKVNEDLFPEFRFDLDVPQHSVMLRDARPSTRAIRKPVHRISDVMEGVTVAYSKGKSALSMAEQWIGQEAFRRGVLDYLDAHAWSSAEAGDLWTALAQSSGEDVVAVIADFIEQPGVPFLIVEPLSDNSVQLRQRRFLNYGIEAPEQTWRFPVRLRYSIDGAVHTRTVLMTQERQQVDLEGPVEWIFPDDGAHGYYRWQVPAEFMLPLAENAVELLSARERRILLGNTAALLDAGVIPGGEFLGILAAFADDPEPRVISSLTDGLNKIKAALVPDDLREAFAFYVRQTLAPAAQRFGLAYREGEQQAVTMLRPSLLSWLGDMGQDLAVQAYADSVARRYMEDPASVDPAIVRTVVRLAALNGDRALHDAYREHYEATQVPAQRRIFLGSLGSFGDPAIRDAALEYGLSGSVRPTDLFVIPNSMRIDDSGRDRAMRWAFDHYEAVASTLPPHQVAYLPRLGGGCSRERLEEARGFFSDPEHRVDGTEAMLKQVTDQVSDCASLRDREGESVREYLTALAGP